MGILILRLSNATDSFRCVYKAALLMAIGLLLPIRNLSADELLLKPSLEISLGQDQASKIRLEARQAPLAQILIALGKKTRIQIHYSVLPEGMVTATCVGSNVKPVLECLLATKSDLVFRYPQIKGKNASYQPTEAWILGAKYTTGITQVVAFCPKQPDTPTEQPVEPDRTDELVAKAKSQDPAERASAIGELLSQGRPDDADVLETLQEALDDKDANVRAQAISTYASREGEKAFAALQEALHDNNAWVRQMAVGSTDEKNLLQQALNDSEESVRSLAAQKLKSLETRTENAQ